MFLSVKFLWDLGFQVWFLLWQESKVLLNHTMCVLRIRLWFDKIEPFLCEVLWPLRAKTWRRITVSVSQVMADGDGIVSHLHVV